MRTDDVDEVLRTTRAVRRRLDLERPVERRVVLECIEIALQAPTASNGQDWRWVVVEDRATRRGLAELYRSAGAEYLAAAAAGEQDPQTRRVYESALELTTTLERVPLLVVPCIERRIDGAPNAVAAAAYGSILPAAWSFLLALRARGLGSVWTTLHLRHEAEAARLLGIPDHVTQVAMFPVAHVTGGPLRPASRPPVETVVHWDRWGSHPAR